MTLHEIKASGCVCKHLKLDAVDFGSPNYKKRIFYLILKVDKLFASLAKQGLAVEESARVAFAINILDRIIATVEHVKGKIIPYDLESYLFDRCAYLFPKERPLLGVARIRKGHAYVLAVQVHVQKYMVPLSHVCNYGWRNHGFRVLAGVTNFKAKATRTIIITTSSTTTAATTATTLDMRTCSIPVRV